MLRARDGKDFRKENGDILKTDVKKQRALGKSEKELGKDAITVELLNYDGDGAKKSRRILKRRT